MSEAVGDVLGDIDPFDILGGDEAEEAQKKNEANVAKGLKALRGGYGEALDVFRGGFAGLLSDIEGLGQTSRLDAKDQFQAKLGGYAQSGLGRGLNSSTVQTQYQDAARRDYVRDLAGINEGLAELRSNIILPGLGMETGLLTGLGQAEAGFRSGVQYQAPPGLLDQLGGPGGIASLFAAFSDERLKRDIRRVGRVGRHSLYSWTWRASGLPGRGVIAQEVQRYLPEAVFSTPSGFLAVAYGRL